ncbi:MAG TPA: hypothetical protein VHN19_08390 [Burkholderiales bacterium]|nr:hypothetical protein [Burkholderiales bacterium]
MKTLRLSLLAAALALAFAAQAQTSSTRIQQRFSSFAGSDANSASLVTGLRTGGAIKLTGAGETTTFTSPTKPMGYGNVTRALDLAQRELAAGGITDPTPKELQAALMGGTVSGPNGELTYQGVLQMRADGMGWGQIAHEIGVHPGLGRPVTTASSAPTTSSGSGITNAAGGSAFSRGGNGQGRALGGSQKPSQGATVSSAAGSAAGGLGIVKGGGSANGNAFGHAR